MVGYWLSSGQVDRKTIVYRSSLVGIKKNTYQYPINSTHSRSLPDQRDPYSICFPGQHDRYPIATRSCSRSLLDLTRAHSTATQSFAKVVQIWQSLITCYEHEEITSTTSRMSRKGRKTCSAAAFFNHEATTLSPPPSNSRPP